MPRIPFRELVFAALHQHLRASFPDLVAWRVERNAANELPSDAILPVLRCRDGGQWIGDLRTVPEEGYRMEWTVYGWVTAVQEADLSLPLYALHGRLIEAMTAAPIVVDLPDMPLEIWLDEAGMEAPDFAGVDQSEHPTASFEQVFSFQITRPRGMAFVDVP